MGTGTEDAIPESIPEIVSSQPSPDRRKLFRKLAALAGLGITGVLLSQDKTGLLPAVSATAVSTGTSNTSGNIAFWDGASDITGNSLLSTSSGSGNYVLTVSTVANTAAEHGILVIGPAYGVGAGIQLTTSNFFSSDTTTSWQLLGTGNTASQGINKFNVRDLASSTDVFTIDGANDYVGVGTTSPLGKLHVVSSASTTALIAQGASSQTADLQEWQNSSGTVLSKVIGNTSGIAPVGAFLGPQVGQTTPNVLSGNQGNVNLPGTSSSSLVMCGMKFLFTPKVSGNLIGFFTGQIANTVAGGRPRASVNYGSGTPPNNGAANTGTSINSVLAADVIGYGANQVQPITFPFSINSANNGGPLTVGTQYWFDVAQAAAVAGFTTVTNNFFVILEI